MNTKNAPKASLNSIGRVEAPLMISPVQDTDLEEVRDLIAVAVRQNVAGSEQEAAFLIDDIDDSLTWWLENQDAALHLKYAEAGRILGVILIKKFWNLTNLFVHPDNQGVGIGRELMLAAFEACRERSLKGKLQVNSSTNAVGFYKRLGFEQTGPGIDRPGGCVPLEYLFQFDHPTVTGEDA